jgi:hypothetical protein
MIRRPLAWGLVMIAALGGCASGGPFGSLVAESLGENPVVLPGEYVVGVYAERSATEVSLLMSDVPLEQLVSGEVAEANVVHLDLLWIPQPGATPMDRAATNVCIRYVVIADGEVGVYGGAGFALPGGKVGASRLGLDLRDASLTLLESTDGFVDLLSPARLTGTVSARRNEKRTEQALYAVSQLVTNALGRTFFVRDGSPGLYQAAQLCAGQRVESRE